MILPITAEVNREGHLVIGGNDLVKLKEEYGTPLYIIDITTVKDRCRSYKKNFTFTDLEVDISYAAKAFICTAMCQLIDKEGLGIDVATGGELFIALNSGFPAEKIYFHGNNKSYEENKYGLESKVGHFMVDNFMELETCRDLWAKNEAGEMTTSPANPRCKV